MGLINAIDSFDPAHNVKLKTYAEYRIRGAILDSIRGMDGVPPHKRKRVKEIQAAIAKLEQTLQRPPRKKKSPRNWASAFPAIRTCCWNCARSRWAVWMLRSAKAARGR